MDEAEIAEEIGWMLDQANWPNWPILPVKKRGADEVGVVFASNPSEVRLINIWAIEHDTDWSKVGQINYTTVDEMVRDGWVGD